MIPCGLVAAAALLIALVTYARGDVIYSAACTFQVSLPVTSVGTNDNLVFEQKASQNDVTQVSRGDIFSGPAKAVGADPATVAAGFAVAQVQDTTTFALTATDADQQRAADLANRLCDEFVQRISATHTQARDAEISQLQGQITTMQQSIESAQTAAAAKPSPADQAFLDAEKKAIVSDQQLLAQTLSLPPDNISVITRAPQGVRQDQRSLARNLLVAGIGALLASFLIILVGEMARDVRSATAPSAMGTSATR